MIKNMTWGNYIQIVASLTIVYYTAIFLLLYRRELQELLIKKRRFQTTHRPLAESMAVVPSPDQTPTSEQRYYDEVNRLMQELKPLFNAGMGKPELLQAIQSKLKDFPSLKETGFQITINNFLKAQAELTGSAPLGADELRGLW